MENRSLNIIVLLAVVLVGLAARAQALCGECLPNGVACLNDTSFQLCLGVNRDKRDESQTLTCPPGQICTGMKPICVPIADAGFSCEEDPACGACATLGGFTCLSKSTFALCVGGQPTSVRGKCPIGSICDASSSSTGVCVDQCGATPTCNLEDPK